MQLKPVAWGAVAALAWSGGTCEAARRVGIRIVPRQSAAVEESEPVGPFPLRPAEPASGPFSAAPSPVGCITGTPVDMDGQPVLLDICHLKNVTFIEIPQPGGDSDSLALETKDPATVDSVEESTGSEGSGSSEDEAASEETEAISSPPMRKIMGMYHGWHIDPITSEYKEAIFDDGDECRGNERYSIAVELVRTPDFDAAPRVFDFRKLSTCSYAVRVEAYLPSYELMASAGIHSDGVIDISDPQDAITKICGETKCRYSELSDEVATVMRKVETMQQSLRDLVSGDTKPVAALSLSSASSIIKSSTEIMESALALLHMIETLQVETDSSNVEKEIVAVSSTVDATDAEKGNAAQTDETDAIVAVDLQET